MKYIYLIMFFLTCSVAVSAGSTSEQGENEQKAIIIRLKKQFNAPAYVQKEFAGVSTDVKRSKAISTLKSFSRQSQESVLSFLKENENTQQVSNIKQFWMANVISCHATDQIIEILKSREDVEGISFDSQEKIIDDEVPAQANTRNTGSTAYNIEMVRALEANEYGYTGKGVVVAVLDTGVNPDHEDIKGSLWTSDEFPEHGKSFVPSEPTINDGNGHGTHCAGTVLGNGKSGIRTGVAPEAKVMVLKVADAEGKGSQSTVWEAIQFAAEHGANVLSMSLGFIGEDNNTKKIWREMMTNLLSSNALAVVAAGNEGDQLFLYPVPGNVRSPGNSPAAWLNPEQQNIGATSSVVTIGATTKPGTSKLGMSSIGPVTWQSVEGYEDYPYRVNSENKGLLKPDVVAPGQNIPSLDAKNPTGYIELSGTSMATPCVAGIVAAMLTKNPELTPAEIVQILNESAIKLTQKFNNQTGGGRTDALLATMYTPNIGMNCIDGVFNKNVGQQNGEINPGNEGILKLSFKNDTEEDISDYQLEIKLLSSHGTIENITTDLPVIKAGEVTEIANACTMKLLATARINSLADVAIIIRKGDKVWTNLIRYKVVKEGSSIEETKANTLSITCSKEGSDCLVKVGVPNPTSAIISIYGPNGQMLRQSQEYVNENTTIRIPTNGYKGMHFITVNTGKETVAQKIIF